MSVGANTWVVVKDHGRKRIRQINAGDLVLAHHGRFQPVVEVLDEGIVETWRLHTKGNRQLLVSEDQKILTGAPSWRHRPDRSWKKVIDLDWTDPFDFDAPQLVRAPGYWEGPGDDEIVACQLQLMAAVLAMGERHPAGGWIMHQADQWVHELIARLDLRCDETGDGRHVLHEVPYLDDTPVEGSFLPRVMFTANAKSTKWMIDCLLDWHGRIWPWKAGHYLRTSSFEAAAHLQHVLLRAGYMTGIDCGNPDNLRGQYGSGLDAGNRAGYIEYRWLLGEGPVWRVQIRNPSNHPVSRTNIIAENEDTEAEIIHSIDRSGPAHCMSLMMASGSSGFTANDLAVADASRR